MVSRKPVPNPDIRRLSQGGTYSSLPYPSTPTSPIRAHTDPYSSQQLPASLAPASQNSLVSGFSESQSSISSGWQGEPDNWLSQPESGSGSRTERAKKGKEGISLPPALQVGPSSGTPRSSFDSQRSWDAVPETLTGPKIQTYEHLKSTNPYRHPHHKEPEVSQSQEESSADLWAEPGTMPPARTPPVPSRAPPAPPTESRVERKSVPCCGSPKINRSLDTLPLQQIDKLSVIDHGYAPTNSKQEHQYRPEYSDQAPHHYTEPVAVADSHAGDQIWAGVDQPAWEQQMNGQPPGQGGPHSKRLPNEAHWEDTASTAQQSYGYEDYASELPEDQPDWEDVAPRLPSRVPPIPTSQPLNEDAFPPPQPSRVPPIPKAPLLDQGDIPPPQPPCTPMIPLEQEYSPPPVPPRSPPPQPPPGPPPSHLQNTGSSEQNGPGLEVAQARVAKQRSETYQIRQVNWVDSTSPKPRTSPIMVQNANGPCPLLALVNALTLTTPANTTTALIETLQVKEQVSLGLLLDAVFDELIGRRGDAAQDLPDVTELYSFLITLHTGMNVNPRFIPPTSTPADLLDSDDIDSTLLTHIYRKPGAFEETKEMKLYGTFSIPLIHGWIPPSGHPAYDALARSAQTYEDAQNLLFRQEELEYKLSHHGLAEAEQLLLSDIESIKFFLESSATQLTGYGLDTITEALAPGAIAILFRNDHFSTLYKHPQSGQLMTLVTDLGYAGHDEVVWESLVDIRGEGCEYFAGDFRPVGHGPSGSQEPRSSSQPGDGWTTVTRPGQGNKLPANRASNSPNNTSSTTPLESAFSETRTPSNTEQEDHDLALAMQLQEEEEDRSHREAEARRRENQLSQAYLDSQESPSVSAVRGGRGQTVRPLVPPRGGSNTARSGRGAGNSTARTSTPTTRRVPTPPPPQPPRTSTLITNRRDPEAGEEAPPPSYEQAAKSSPYVPPPDNPPYSSTAPGLPGSIGGYRPPATSPPGSGGRQRHNSTAYAQQSAYTGSTSALHGTGGRGDRHSASGPNVVRRRSAGGNGGLEGEDERRDKDCVVM
ncbi:MAG: hypothetical protein MMC33_003838 [Icmadophila ericetorum]|nr:hypothetical protein [Icmadophila ericetorum]